MNEKNPWQIIDKETKYENNWIKVIHHNVKISNGNIGVYGVVEFKNIAVGIIALDENNDIYLVGQFRFPLNQYSWEIPEGGCLIEKELPLDAAKRELLEEVGLIAEHWTELGKIHTSNSVCDEIGYIFLAEKLQKTNSNPEETEILQIKKVNLNTAFEMVMKNEITDSISITGIMKAYYLKSQ